MTDYNDIFKAHYKTKLPLMLWGSSGYGKTSLVVAYARAFNLKLQVLHAQYIDPMALFIPDTHNIAANGYVKFYPSDFLYRIFTAKEPTVLFLDELNRAREDTLNILTELLLERKVFGHAVGPSVQIIGASNFPEEDGGGVRDLPDAVMQRLTHIVHSPKSEDSARFLNSPSARALAAQVTKLIQQPGSQNIHALLKACPRQIDACGMLAEVGGLRGKDLILCCQGRVGVESGAAVAAGLERILRGKAFSFPEKLTPATYEQVKKIEYGGSVVETIEYLKSCIANQDEAQRAAVAVYLLRYAKPETVRAMQQSRFAYIFKERAPLGDDGAPIDQPGLPWQMYATKIGKLVSR
jgi:hypothetical protein